MKKLKNKKWVATFYLHGTKVRIGFNEQFKTKKELKNYIQYLKDFKPSSVPEKPKKLLLFEIDDKLG